MAIETTYTGTGVIAANTVLMPVTLMDRGGYVTLQITSLGASGQVRVDHSHDGITWLGTSVRRLGTPGTVLSGTASSAGMYSAIVVGKYVRAVLSNATTSGNTNVVFRAGEGNSVDLSGDPVVTVTVAAGNQLIGKFRQDVGAAVSDGPAWLINRLVSAAATTNPTLVKAAAGRVMLIRGHNAAAAVRYLKLYNKASAPTVGTDTPVLTIPLKASDVFELELNPHGLQFSTGIAYAITTGATDADTGALTAADVVGLGVLYI